MLKPDIIVYTRWFLKRKSRPGGYGIVMQKFGSNYIKEFSEGYRITTNNRMELLAVIISLEKIKKEIKWYMFILIQNTLVIQSRKNGYLIGKKRTLKTKRTLIFGLGLKLQKT